jgi:hypothetical protein
MNPDRSLWLSFEPYSAPPRLPGMATAWILQKIRMHDLESPNLMPANELSRYFQNPRTEGEFQALPSVLTTRQFADFFRVKNDTVIRWYKRRSYISPVPGTRYRWAKAQVLRRLMQL